MTILAELTDPTLASLSLVLTAVLTRFIVIVCTAAACLAAGCTGDAGEADTSAAASLHFDTASVRIITKTDTILIAVELAVSGEQKSTGLMERRQVSDSAGMLFVYDALQPEDAGFWMYRTRIPLDIAYMDADGRIRAIAHMVPCETSVPQGCPTYPPGVPYQYALEVNGGFLARRGVAIGDLVTVGDATRQR